MFESSAFAKSEMQYRGGRIRDGVLGRRRGRGRAPRVRRPSGDGENAR